MLRRALTRRPRWAALLCGLLALLTLGEQYSPLRLVAAHLLKFEAPQRVEEDERGEESKALSPQTADRRHGRTRVRIWPTAGLLTPRLRCIPPRRIDVPVPLRSLEASPHKRNALGISLRC